MAIHDYEISNASGTAVRADLNDALGAIITQNSNPDSPPVTFVHMWWYDTTNHQLKQRNASDDGWIILGEVSGNNWIPYHNGVPGSSGLSTSEVNTLIATHTSNASAHHAKTPAGLSSTQVNALIATHASNASAHHVKTPTSTSTGGLTASEVDTKISTHASDASAHHDKTPAGLTTTEVNKLITNHASDASAHHDKTPAGLTATEVDTKISTHASDASAHHDKTPVLTPGTSANNVVQLDSNARIPAIDGSLLTNLHGYLGKSASYTVVAADDRKTIACSASGGERTINLPASSSISAGFSITIIKTDSSDNNVVIDGNGSDTINNSATHTLETRFEAAALVWTGTSTDWLVVNQADISSNGSGGLTASEVDTKISTHAGISDAHHEKTPAGNNVDQTARDAAASAQTTANSAQSDADTKQDALVLPSTSEAESGTATVIRGWTAALISALVAAKKAGGEIIIVESVTIDISMRNGGQSITNGASQGDIVLAVSGTTLAKVVKIYRRRAGNIDPFWESLGTIGGGSGGGGGDGTPAGRTSLGSITISDDDTPYSLTLTEAVAIGHEVQFESGALTSLVSTGSVNVESILRLSTQAGAPTSRTGGLAVKVGRPGDTALTGFGHSDITIWKKAVVAEKLTGIWVMLSHDVASNQPLRVYSQVYGGGLNTAEVNALITTHTSDASAHHTKTPPGDTGGGLNTSQVNALIATHTSNASAHHVKTPASTSTSTGGLTASEVDTKISTHAGISDAHHDKTPAGLTATEVDTKISTHASNASAHHDKTPAGLTATEVDTKISTHAGISNAHHDKTLAGLTASEVDTKISTHASNASAHHDKTPAGLSSTQVNALISTHASNASAHHAKTPVLTPGTSANNVVQLDSNARIPAIDGSLLTNLHGYLRKSASYTVVAADDRKTIACSASGGERTVNLPASSSISAGFSITIIKTDASSNNVVIDGNGSDTINNSATHTLETRYEAVTLVWTGTSIDWLVINQAEISSNGSGGLTASEVDTKISTHAGISNAHHTKTPVLTPGTSANNVIQLDSNARIPALDGRQLTNLHGYLAKTANYTVVAADDRKTIACISIFTEIVINLPVNSSISTGFLVTLAKLDPTTNSNITINGNESDTINGSATYVLKTQYEAVTLIWTGTGAVQWLVLNHDKTPAGDTGGGLTTAQVNALISTHTSNASAHHVKTPASTSTGGLTASEVDTKLTNLHGYLAKTANYTVVAADNRKTIACSASSEEHTITLPASSGISAGFSVTLVKTDSSRNGVIIDGNSSDTINFSSNYSLRAQYEFATLVWTGTTTDWLVVNGERPSRFVSITDATNIGWYPNTEPIAQVTLSSNRNLSGPHGGISIGSIYIIVVRQDSTGSRTLSFSTGYDFGVAGTPALSSTANMFDILPFFAVADSSGTSKLRSLGIAKGFT